MNSIRSTPALTKAQLRLEQTSQELSRRKAIEFLPKSCSICVDVIRFLGAPIESRAEISLGKWEEVLSSTCEIHSALFPSNDALASREIFLRKPEGQSLIYVHPDPYRIDALALEAPWEGSDSSRSSKLFGQSSHRPRVRIVDPHWIDLDLLKGWYTECQATHERCSNLPASEPSSSTEPSLLVDVLENCLVRGNSTCSYFALSYVWGKVSSFKTTRENLNWLFRPGTLGLAIVAEKLPRTIREAMALTQSLGERYLWIDALCIIQDSEDKMTQLNAMASIFAGARLTIVAAQGKDANAGFRGLPQISVERNADQRVVTLLPTHQLMKPNSKQVWDGSLLKPWSTRAWTFQEEICSHRILYFAHDSVRWTCKAAQWSEESDCPDCLLRYANAEQRQQNLEAPKLSASILPNLTEYEALVNGFNCRALTYPEDALSAFAGVSTRLAAKFVGSMISGLPELFFDVCLLWQPQRRSGPVQRRESKVKSVDCVLPSWSWVGWVTEVTWPYTWNYSLDFPAPTPVVLEGGKIRPFYRVELYYIDERGSKILLQNSWHDAFDREIPPEWSRHKLRDSQLRSLQDDYGRINPCYFKHDSDPTVRFWFPVPICKAPQLPKTIKLVELRTMAGKYKLGERRRHKTRINALDGTPAGILWQHDEDEDYVRATFSGCSIDLIALLGCIVPQDGHIWDASDVALPDIGKEPVRIKEIYNVMWIQWDGDIAYRKATGEVDRDVWERYAREVNVTLG